MSYFAFSCQIFMYKLSGLITSVGKERAIFLQSISCNIIIWKAQGVPQ